MSLFVRLNSKNAQRFYLLAVRHPNDVVICASK
jgi:hypothetical protein